MARPDGRVQPGQRLDTAFSARAWNRAQDAADLVLGDRLGVAAQPGRREMAPYRSVLCRNSSVQDVPRWGILGILGMESPPTGESGPALKLFERMPVLVGVEPLQTTTHAFVVAVEPIARDAIGMVAVDGIVQVKVDVKHENDETVGPKIGNISELQTGSGHASILWKEPGLGSGKWALVRLGAERGVRLGQISSTWPKNEAKQVTPLNGSGSTKTNADTFTAYNHFATISVFSGTRKVACQLIDNTWVLIAAEC